MGRELLEWAAELLSRGGIPAGEGWPGGVWVEPGEAVAAVGLRELDWVREMATVSVDILSPRRLGGWCCQLAASDAARLLHGAGFVCETGEMAYQEGSDCFRVPIRAKVHVAYENGSWTPAGDWEVLCDGVRQEGVSAFRAVRDQGRKLLGAMGQGEPVGITAGAGGWTIELVQNAAAEPEGTAEPFVLTVRRGRIAERFGGCCWNETILEYGEQGLRVTRRGFALTREGNADD